MFYDDTQIDEFVKELKIPGGQSYVEHTAKAIGQMLIKQPWLYKTFGVYWWAMKDALRKYAPKPGAWYMGKYDDVVMKARAWHGDEFRTILAAAHYHSDMGELKRDHEWFDKYGNEHIYALEDPNGDEVRA